MRDVWTKYKVKGTFVDKVYGGIPSDPDVIEGYLLSKKLPKEEKEAAQRLIDKAQELTTVEGQISKVTNIFLVDEKGVYLMNYQFAAGLKEAMSVQKSITSWRSKMQRGVRVMPPLVYLTRDGSNVRELDGFEQVIVHTEDPNYGTPKTSLKRVAFIVKPSFEFEVWVANDKDGPIISPKVLRGLLDHCEVTGFGGMHSMGKGQNAMELEVPEDAKRVKTKAEEEAPA